MVIFHRYVNVYQRVQLGGLFNVRKFHHVLRDPPSEGFRDMVRRFIVEALVSQVDIRICGGRKFLVKIH